MILAARKLQFNPLRVLIAMDWTMTFKDSPHKDLLQLKSAFMVRWRTSTKDGIIDFTPLVSLN
jgi:hypothetical protein